MFQNLIKLSLITTALIIIGFLAITNQGVASHTSGSGNVLGWLWFGTFNDGDIGTDCNPNTSDPDCGSAGWISASAGNNYAGHDANSPGYGLTVPSADGPVSGKVWASNLGWIDFTGVQRSSNTLTGFAQIESIRDAGNNSGGWQGQIKLSGNATDGKSYGVSVNDSTGFITGSAWSDEIGWVDFNVQIGGSSSTQCTDGISNGDNDILIDGADPECTTSNGVTEFPPPSGPIVTCSGNLDIPYSNSSPAQVTWSATVSYGNPTTFDWDFDPDPVSSTGDGTKTVVATYNLPGIVTATVTATESDGDFGSASCSVNVNKKGIIEEIIPFLP